MASNNRPVHILLISPHPDDIALSLGGWVKLHVLRARSKITLLTCFSVSRYAPNLAFHDESRISTHRQNEDATYCRENDILYRHLALRDSSAQGIDETKERSITIDPARRSSLTDSLIPLICEYDVVIAPLALGDHVDHRITQEVIEVSCPPGNLIWYEDLPYAAELRLSCFKSRLNSVARGQLRPFVIEINTAIEQKIGHLTKTYFSQDLCETIPAIRKHASRVSDRCTLAERVWALDTATPWAEDLGFSKGHLVGGFI